MSRGRPLQSDSGLVVADSELASEAGMVILKRGGNAVDAAIATALALSVVDQASSGLGGGGFMVFYRAKDKQSFRARFSRDRAGGFAARALYERRQADGVVEPHWSPCRRSARRSGRSDRGGQALRQLAAVRLSSAGDQARRPRHSPWIRPWASPSSVSKPI